MAELIAWVDGREVGRLSEHHVADGTLFTFEYVEGATAEDLVSLTMIPLPQQRRFDSRSFPPAFDMILPEGERRHRIEAARKIVRADAARLFDECLAAVDNGLKQAETIGKQIEGFAELAATLIKLWTGRVATFRA